MAELLFGNKAGVVSSWNLGAGAAPGFLEISGQGGLLSKKQPVIVRSIGISQDVSAQFVTSLQKVVYVYCFGDKVGQINVNGVAFSRYCAGSSAQGNFTGPNAVLQYYDASRAIDEKRTMKVTIGSQNFQGYLIAMNLQTENTELATFSFGFTIATIPKQVGAQ